jgi:hypothetical protein
MTRLLTFDTTHHALLAEQVALEHGFAVQVTPAPPDSGAACDLALEYFTDDDDALAAALHDAAVVFRRYRPVPQDDAGGQ